MWARRSSYRRSLISPRMPYWWRSGDLAYDAVWSCRIRGQLSAYPVLVSDERTCEQSGAGFVPRREHARFCSAACRVAWNGVHTGHRAAQVSALQWSLTAMGEATGRLEQLRAADLSRGLAAISEAVWWVTLVDATLVRYHPGDYDRVLAGYGLDERRVIEGTLGGLRFVRNRLGRVLDPADFASPPARQADRQDRVSMWVWRAVPEPGCGLPERGQQWELARHQCFEAQLTGHCVGETFTRAAAFLLLVASAAGVPAESMSSPLG